MIEQPQLSDRAYLSQALHWLRLRLRQLAKTPAGDRADPPEQRDRSPFLRAAAAPAPEDDGDELRRLAGALEAAEHAECPPAIITLAEQLGLSSAERTALLLCVAHALDTSVAWLCAQAQDAQRAYPTFALALGLVGDEHWEIVSPERPLRYWQLVEIGKQAGQPLISCPLQADERIVNYLKGLHYLDDRLARLCVPIAPSQPADLSPSQARQVGDAVAQICALLAQPPRSSAARPGLARPPIVVQLPGADSAAKQLFAAAIAQAVSPRLQVCRLPLSLLGGQASEIDEIARIWQRESLLEPLVLYLDARDAEGAPESLAVLERLLGRIDGLVFVDTRDVQAGIGASFTLDARKPTAAEQRARWQRSLGEPGWPARLAGQFDLGLGEIGAALHLAAYAPGGEARSRGLRAWDACRERLRPQLDALAQRIEPQAGENDLVLPKAEAELLRQIADQVERRSQVYDEWGFRDGMSRGLGISVLFCGQSGTGKTMAAEVLARKLQLNLYRIDLSAVVSKYIGETEKNLRRLFDAAEQGGAILLFDEADALFGKRSEVKDSHDRYANIEINYLLQRMEAYGGLAILATNMRAALDPAFVRRLRFIVNFPFPAPTERQQIWAKALPARALGAGDQAIEPLDFAFLARLNLTGGSIHNIALSAAFLAAARGVSLGMELVLEAARAEARKQGLPINAADYAWKRPEPPKLVERVAAGTEEAL